MVICKCTRHILKITFVSETMSSLKAEVPSFSYKSSPSFLWRVRTWETSPAGLPLSGSSPAKWVNDIHSMGLGGYLMKQWMCKREGTLQRVRYTFPSPLPPPMSQSWVHTKGTNHTLVVWMIAWQGDRNFYFGIPDLESVYLSAPVNTMSIKFC